MKHNNLLFPLLLICCCCLICPTLSARLGSWSSPGDSISQIQGLERSSSTRTEATGGRFSSADQRIYPPQPSQRKKSEQEAAANVDQRSGEWYQDGDCMVMNLAHEDEKGEGPDFSNLVYFQTKSEVEEEEEDDPPKEPRPHVGHLPRWINPTERMVELKERAGDGSPFKECGRTKYMVDDNSEGEGTRIVGGDEADMNQFPWMVALRTEWGLQFCGGTILNERYVLTAAHCVAWGKGALKMKLVFGDHQLDTDHETDSFVRKAKTIKYHASYSSTNTDYDIALVELDRPIIYSENCRPICMPEKNEELAGEDLWATVSGWGLTDYNGNSSKVLRDVTVRILPSKVCQTLYETAEITPRMFCAGALAGGRDACQGDSGGPLVTHKSKTSSYYQVGIVSWGKGCALAKYPGVYTKISAFTGKNGWLDRHSK